MPQPEPPSSAKSSPLPIVERHVVDGGEAAEALADRLDPDEAGREAAGVVAAPAAPQPVRTSVQARASRVSCSGVQAGGAHIRFTVASSG